MTGLECRSIVTPENSQQTTNATGMNAMAVLDVDTNAEIRSPTDRVAMAAREASKIGG
jgi:hypothetical protein